MLLTMGVRWQALYRRFLHSPNFWPWFRARHHEARLRLFHLARRLRLALRPRDLLAQVTLHGGSFLAGVEDEDEDDAADHGVPSAGGGGGGGGVAFGSVEDGLRLRGFTGAQLAQQQARLATLRAQILASMQREAAWLATDPEHARVVARHLHAVERAMRLCGMAVDEDQDEGEGEEENENENENEGEGQGDHEDEH